MERQQPLRLFIRPNYHQLCLIGNNNLIQGDPDLLALISETWSYKKDLTSTKLNWLLSDVYPNEGDILAADPTPDTKK